MSDEATIEVRVKWAPEYGIGQTDAVDTACCTIAGPAWYVWFENEAPWEGHYFFKSDLEIVGEPCIS